MILEELRAQVLQTALLLPKYGLVWMAGGTVCARDPQTGYIVVTPSGLGYDALTPEDMIVTDMEMNLVEGKFRPSVALSLWIGFLRARTELNAVVHTHSPHATAFSVVYEFDSGDHRDHGRLVWPACAGDPLPERGRPGIFDPPGGSDG